MAGKSKGEFSVGDTVQLKSGGPVMTVSGRLSSGEVKCQWFGGKKLENGFFPVESLVPAEIEQGQNKK